MASSGDDAPLAVMRAPTAAEKRAARRARVLESGERRLKLLTGEIGSLKPENEAVEKAMDEGIAELLDATELPTPVVEEAETAAVSEIKIPSRVDPAQRRRDAQARRQKKEAMVQEILSGGSSASTAVAGDASMPPLSALAAEVHADATTSVRTELSEKRVVEPAFSRHALALRLRSAEEKLILVAIVAAALYMAFATDLRNVTTDLLTSNPLFLLYQQLVANGVSLEAIRQQMQRENIEPVLMDQIERVFVSQRKSEHLHAAAASASLMRSFVPNFADLPGFFASWLSQPPIILCVLLLRVLVGLLGGALHTLFKLPEVTTPKDDDLGFVANLALASRPALKEYVVKTRKSVDDVFLFLWSFVLAVAARSVVAAHAGPQQETLCSTPLDPSAMAKRGGVASSVGERLLRVEFARRKNRRASITEQFIVPLAKSRRKEKIAQTRHHAFLQQPENRAAIEEIVSRVERLADSEALALGHVLSPMDKHRLHCWANDVRMLVVTFEASGDRENDPVRQLLEKLQGLHEGHPCLAEVAIEARQVVEKWERIGIFDDDAKSSEEEGGEENEETEDDGLAPDLRSPQQRTHDWENEKRRKMEASYAYQCVRERAAAHVIKRNTLQWVRSRAAFCSRVAELEVFGNTTAALVEELSTMSELQRRTAVSSARHANDVFDLVKGKRLVTGGQKIDFADLMHFAKHLALFTVDHAVRRVDEIDHKRRLFQLRCLIKLQTWWRKMHVVVKGRRMLKLVEEMKRKKEEERMTELLLRQQETMKAKGIQADSRVPPGKTAKPGGKSVKGSNSMAGLGSNPGGSSSHSLSSLKPDGGGESSTRSLTTIKAASRVAKDARAMMPTPPSTPKTSNVASGGGGASKPKRQSVAANKDDKLERMSRAARARQARLRKEFEEEMKRREREDDEAARDTGDVETAWQRFMESANNADGNDSEWDEERRSTPESVASRVTGPRGETPLTRDGEGEQEEWREWSDDDEDHESRSAASSRGTTPSSSSAVSSRLSTPHASRTMSRPPSNETSRASPLHRPMPPTRVVVTVTKRPLPRQSLQTQTTPDIRKDDPSLQAASHFDGLELPYAAAPSPSRRQLLFGVSQARQSRPALPGTGLLSKFMPFAELPKERLRLLTPPSTAVTAAATPRRHLHEFDFGLPQAGRPSATLDMILLTQPLVEEVRFVAPDPNIVVVASAPTATPVRVFSSIRANRVARIRAALEAKGTDQLRQSSETDDVKAEADDSEMADNRAPSRATSPEPFVVVNTDVRNALLRPIRGRASLVDAYISNPMLKLDFRREDAMRKSKDAHTKTEILEEMVAAPTESLPDTLTHKTKPGSHTDWLRSMGLDNVVTIAARSVNATPPTSSRIAKKKASLLHQPLATSVLAMEEASAKRARRKRKQEHALPLLGRRLPSKKKPIQHAPKTPLPVEAERRTHDSLPSVEARVEPVAAQLPDRRSHVRERKPTVQDAKDHRLSFTGPARSSTSERSLDLSGDTDTSGGEEDDGGSSCKNDASDGDDPDMDSGVSEDSDQDSVESDSGKSEDGYESSGQELEVDKSTDGIVSRNRKTSERGRRQTVRDPNERKRSSLHEPRHPKERRRRQRPRGRRTRMEKKQSVRDLAERVGEHNDSLADPSPAKKRSLRFKAHAASLFRRLVVKENQRTRDRHHSSAEEGVDEEDDGLYESDASVDADESPDPERAAAFFRLYSQYMGLLSAAPILGGQVR